MQIGESLIMHGWTVYSNTVIQRQRQTTGTNLHKHKYESTHFKTTDPTERIKRRHTWALTLLELTVKQSDRVDQNMRKSIFFTF